MNASSDDVLWQSIKSHIDENMDLMDVRICEGSVEYCFHNPSFPEERSSATVRIRRYTTTLGIDVQGYSTLPLDEQFLASVRLFTFVEKTADWFSVNAPTASSRPDAIIPTGDGAYLFFKEEVLSFRKALNFAGILNMHFQATNNQYPLIGATYDGLKIPMRFAIEMGDGILMKDPNGNTNVVGESIIGCSRILSCDKGTHFLLGQKAADNLVQNFGGVRDGIVSTFTPLFGATVCAVSDRLVQPVKGREFCFYNVHLTHDVINLKDSIREQRQNDGLGYAFTLGDHNLEVLRFRRPWYKTLSNWCRKKMSRVVSTRTKAGHGHAS